MDSICRQNISTKISSKICDNLTTRNSKRNQQSTDVCIHVIRVTYVMIVCGKHPEAETYLPASLQSHLYIEIT